MMHCIASHVSSKEYKRPSLSAMNSQDGYKMFDVQWHRMYDKFPDFENNKSHRDCYFKWKNLKQTVLAGSGIDSQLQKQIQTEIEKKKKKQSTVAQNPGCNATLGIKNFTFQR